MLQSIRSLGVDAELGGQLASDFQFDGHGPDGSILVGIERKTIQDLCNSIRDRRFEGQQLGPLVNTYDVRYIVIEGIWRRGETGFIEQMFGREWRAIKGGFRYAEADSYLCWLEEFYHVRCWRCGYFDETAAFIVSRYKWWQKQYSEHHKPAIYAPAPDTRQKRGHKPQMFRREATLLEKIVAQLPGVDGRAIEVAARFDTVDQMVSAGAEEWVERCKGLRLGKKSAEVIVDALRISTRG